MKEEEILNILRIENEEFRILEEEHKNLDKELSVIDKRVYLTPEEELKRKELQKQKLLKKDKMAALIREYKHKHMN